MQPRAPMVWPARHCNGDVPLPGSNIERKDEFTPPFKRPMLVESIDDDQELCRAGAIGYPTTQSSSPEFEVTQPCGYKNCLRDQLRPVRCIYLACRDDHRQREVWIAGLDQPPGQQSPSLSDAFFTQNHRWAGSVG